MAPEYANGKINTDLKAMKALEDTGGTIIRDASGKATGVLVDTVMPPIARMIPVASPELLWLYLIYVNFQEVCQPFRLLQLQ